MNGLTNLQLFRKQRSACALYFGLLAPPGRPCAHRGEAIAAARGLGGSVLVSKAGESTLQLTFLVSRRASLEVLLLECLVIWLVGLPLNTAIV